MTNKHITVAMAAAALALAGCTQSGGSDSTQSGPGSKTDNAVEFNLDISGSDSVDTINLNIMCAGINQDHVLDVSNGHVDATFGGLEPGDCIASLTATTSDGYDCDGHSPFTVVAGQVTPVAVTLVCVGQNNAEGGGAKVTAEFTVNECTNDRIKKIYAIPSNVMLGDSTIVDVESQNIVGAATWSFSTENDATHVGSADLSMAPACAPGAAACQMATCTSIGGSVAIDPESGLPVAGVWVVVSVEDEECKDSDRVWIECLQGSVCGDGDITGVEQCEDGNSIPNDGCENNCMFTVYCGNGVFDPSQGEECDGALGLTDPGVQQCGADCTIIPICGNGYTEGSESCDDGNLVNDDECTNLCQLNTLDPCTVCVNSPPIDTYTDGFCDPVANPTCAAVLDCYIESACFATAATVADCFCGLGVSNATCEAPGYVAAGPCAAEITAAAGNDSPSNAVILQRYYDIGYPLGWAGQIMLTAQSECPDACMFP